MVGYRLRALETSDIEVLLEWENHPEQWEVSLRNTPYSRTVLEQYITAAAADFWEIGQVRFVLCEAGNDRP
jgi:diamine N-acetyltransferase